MPIPVPCWLFHEKPIAPQKSSTIIIFHRILHLPVLKSFFHCLSHHFSRKGKPWKTSIFPVISGMFLSFSIHFLHFPVIFPSFPSTQRNHPSGSSQGVAAPPRYCDCAWRPGVVVEPLWKIGKSNGIIFPNIWKNKSHVPNHQTEYNIVNTYIHTHINMFFIFIFKYYIYVSHVCLSYYGYYCDAAWSSCH